MTAVVLMTILVMSFCLPSLAAAAVSKEADKTGLTPVSGANVKDGEYEVDMESSSGFFRIYSCRLTVKNGIMTAVMTVNSTSYECVFMGTAEQAAKASESNYIFADEENGRGSFTIPVKALNAPMECAAFSKKKKQWYDRTLRINAASLPKGALTIELPDEEWTEEPVLPARVDMEDGTYSIEVNMTGGSGRASVSSPTWFMVKDGKAYAKLLWSSSHYDYMKLNGETFENETTDGGNSTFTIPVAAFDKPIPVIADTTAMGSPMEIEYELTFYKETVNSVSKVPQEAAKRVVFIALIIIVVGGILNFFVKRRRKQ